MDFFLKALERLAETFADFRQFSGPENDQDDDQNQDEFCNAH